MRVLQIANFVSPTSGGLRTSIDNLRRGYQTRGWTVGRITPYPDPQDSGDFFHIRSLRLPTTGNYRILLSRKSIMRAITDFKPDIVELSDKTTLAWLAKWCSRKSIPCCVISHERLDYTLQHAGILTSFLLFMARKWKSDIEKYATHIVCASKFAAEEFTISPDRLSLIPLGVAVESVEPRLERNRKTTHFVIVMCSRLSKEKRLELVFDAVRELSAKVCVHLRVIGDGPLRESLETASRDLPVQFLGHISNRMQIFNEFRDADVVVNFGQFETFGLVTLESLATGTPVVVADSGASPEIVDNTCGRVVSPVPNVIASAIADVLMNDEPELFRQCRQRAEQYSWSKTIDSFGNLYFQLSELGCGK